LTADEIIRHVGGALRDVREATGVGLPEFSKKSGLPVERLALIESGSYPNISIMTLVAYAEAVKLPLHLLADDVVTSFEQITETLNSSKERQDGK